VCRDTFTCACHDSIVRVHHNSFIRPILEKMHFWQNTILQSFFPQVKDCTNIKPVLFHVFVGACVCRLCVFMGHQPETSLVSLNDFITNNTYRWCNMLHTIERHPLQHTATHCKSVQLSATQSLRANRRSFAIACNTLQHTAITATRCSTATTRTCKKSFATHCNTVQLTASHYITLKKATHCNTLCNSLHHTTAQHTATQMQHTATHCNTLQHTATHCNALCNSLHHTTARCNALHHIATQPLHDFFWQHTATCCNSLQLTATHYNTGTTCRWKKSSR